jgi:hypothetical protein
VVAALPIEQFNVANYDHRIQIFEPESLMAALLSLPQLHLLSGNLVAIEVRIGLFVFKP